MTTKNKGGESPLYHFDRGVWFALNHILNLINTLESDTIDKKELYKTIFELRPHNMRDDETWSDPTL